MLKDSVLFGNCVGIVSSDTEQTLNDLRRFCIEPKFNYVSICAGNQDIPQRTFIECAKLLSENKIYFNFLYTVQHAPKGKKSHLEKETVLKMREVAGEYYIGDMIGETGSSFACKFAGYYTPEQGADFSDPLVIRTDYPDMKAAAQEYKKYVSGLVEIDNELEVPNILSVEATVLSRYNCDAGVTIPMSELFCSNSDIAVAALRGSSKAYGIERWGTYVAHEWYGGYRNTDTLKAKRVELAFKYAYLSGSKLICLESGDQAINSFGEKFDYDSEFCANYRRVMQETMEYIRNDSRPESGPRVSLAFVQGRYDAWGSFGGSSVWNQFGREEWGHGNAEYSWRLLDEIGVRRVWHEGANFGEQDTSAMPAYGIYDIVPIEADVDALSQYDTLIFLGWNTMQEDDMDKLTEYVRRGGRLLMSAAHLNTECSRDSRRTFISNEKIEGLFGCRFTGKTLKTNAGIKFRRDSLDETALYPGTNDLYCDPCCSAGYNEYAEIELCGGKEAAHLSESFRDSARGLTVLVENRIGNGIASLITSVDHPGAPACYPLYRTVLRELVSSSARECDIRVLGSDRLRYSVYGDENSGKMYLLNTDFDLPITVKVIRKGVEELITVKSLELKTLEW